MTSTTSRSLQLPRSTPAPQRVDPQGILGFLDAVEQTDVELHSLMVLRHGQVLAEGWWRPYHRDNIQLLYSLSKSFTSSAVGLAVAEGLFSLDDPVISFFPDAVPADAGDHLRAMKVRHLLSMATGHREDTLERAHQAGAGDLVRGFLSIPPDQEPGSIFCYNNSATFVLSAIITHVTGELLLDYLRPRLLEPLGITDALWFDDGHGRNQGFSGLHLATESIAKLGQLYLQRGTWEDRQLLSPEWVDQASSVQVRNDQEENPDWQQGYGFQFWMARHGYRGDGAFGQYCLVLPEQDAVIAITSASTDMQATLDLVWSHLLPAFETGEVTPDESAQARLTERLIQLTLETLPAGEPSADVDLGRPFTPASTSPAGAFPPIESITLSAAEPSTRVLGLHLTDSTIDITCGADAWVENTAPLAPLTQGKTICAIGGWTAPDTFTAYLTFVRTPHRLVITCRTDGSAQTFDLDWNVAPLGPVR